MAVKQRRLELKTANKRREIARQDKKSASSTSEAYENSIKRHCEQTDYESETDDERIDLELQNKEWRSVNLAKEGSRQLGINR